VKKELEIVDLPYKRSHMNVTLGNLFSMTFVYPKPPNEAFLVKGGVKDIEYFLKKKMTNIPAVLHHIIFLTNGRKHKFCELLNMGKLRIRREKPSKFTWNRRFYYIIQLGAPKVLHIKEFRRIPRGWIKELDPYVPEIKKSLRFMDFEDNYIDRLRKTSWF